jgi:tRNA-splicing ligase RtcB
MAHPAAHPIRIRNRGDGAEQLLVLQNGKPPDEGLLERLRAIEALPYVASVLALPDLHQKDKAEIPSSVAVTTRGAIVPEFTSVAVNDGMGIVLTDLEARDVTPERLLDFFANMNEHAARHVLDRNRYSLSAADMAAAAMEGGRAGVRRYDLPETVLDHMEDNGGTPIESLDGSWSKTIPYLLRATTLGRCEMGLNFGGNHFLEVQTVESVCDPLFAARWGLVPGRVTVMYHLGPGPFASTLLHHYSRRKSLHGARVFGFFLSKLLFHFARSRPGSLADRWNLHFRREGWSAFREDSEEGLAFRQALALATNFGFAYRLATVAAIRDSLRAAFSPFQRADLLCDVPHNGVREEPWEDGSAWVARHNACRVTPRQPAIVAGMYDVPSYVGVGGTSAPPELHSYDHGAGHLIDDRRAENTLHPAAGSALRVKMKRGSRQVLAADTLPLRTSAPIDELVSVLAQHDMVQPVVRLRPLGTLKN